MKRKPVTHSRHVVKDGDKYLVYKRYYSEWYTNEYGKTVRDKEDFFDTYFDDYKKAIAYCDRFDLNRNWY